jgi:hypothetical protein
VGTLLPYGYPVGKSKGKDSYPSRLEGKGIPEMDGYANGRVNTLPLPYPTLPIDILCCRKKTQPTRYGWSGSANYLHSSISS